MSEAAPRLCAAVWAVRRCRGRPWGVRGSVEVLSFSSWAGCESQAGLKVPCSPCSAKKCQSRDKEEQTRGPHVSCSRLKDAPSALRQLESSAATAALPQCACHGTVMGGRCKPISNAPT